MLRKLLGYEFKAMGRILLPVYGAVGAVGIISALLTRLSPAGGESALHMPLIMIAVLSMMLFFVGIAAGIIISSFLSIYRFWKNLFTEEGYLMHTLPVKPWQNITAKLLTAVIFQALSIIVTAIAGVCFLIISSAIPASVMFNSIKQIVQSVFSQIFLNGEVIAFLFEIAVLMIVMLISSNMQFYAAISIGCSADKHKLLKSVGVYVLFNFALTFARSFIMIGIDKMPHLGLSPNMYGHILLISIIAAYLLVSAVYFLLSNYFIKNKLNI